ncbi:Cytochrome P450 [Glarea lozoyensis ATCC 20868]|uniref:Cytochrome P450 n=1 Tax=Glarea lozoyensis (strain ATCC 20868 / MF5171) TaxID=1116229 RepID=S3D3V0_GLAL2|nr:Cytochrome P450 [Glarea lozoyensis ATCC 20868]EPE31784.1 Cytochrome P450 [Glarea lozoyensis ATCC 20868]
MESSLRNLSESSSDFRLQTTSQSANIIFSFIENLEITPLNLLVYIPILYLLYIVLLVSYRLYLSPLAKFPGPKIAAATLWTEFYYDAVLGGQFQFKVKEWHEIYGPVVRINPFEIHIDDPKGDFYGTVFSNTGIRDKHEFYTSQFGTGKTGFGTVSHHLHRLRRKAMNPFFQPSNVLRFEPVIKAKLDKLCQRIDQYSAAKLGAMPMRIVFMSYATDVITSFTLNHSWNHLDAPDFNPWWWQTTQCTAKMTKWTKQFPWLLPMLQGLPDFIVKAMDPNLILVLEMQRKIEGIVVDVLSGKDGKYAYYPDGSPRTIFHEILKSDSLPAADRDVEYLWQEGQNFLGAGSDTVAFVLTMATYYLLADTKKAEKLREELRVARADKDTELRVVALMKLPYLTGVVNEALRLSYGTSCRLTRIAPTESLNFQHWHIPAGTPISMSSLMMHHNENIFPQSHTFSPERWADQEDGGKALERYLVSFSKGSRQCIGMGFAKAEIYLTIATLFSRYTNMTLYDTDYDRDVKMVSDMFFPQASKESRGVRVLFGEN